MFASTLIHDARGVALALLLLMPFSGGQAQARTMHELGRDAVIKIYVTHQRENYAMPWQGGAQGSGSGTGFIIKGRRILTNAHLVADARFLEVQKDGDARRYRATVQFVAHDCDVAMLAVEDTRFFDNTRHMTLADSLPTLNDTVTVLGYPLGGDRLSVTRGVVSRMDYATYAHSGVDQHLVLQVDAAINPGNSGGPVLFNGKVVGLAFQGLALADNIGYGIPLPVLERFLTDVEDGTYHGYPELGVAFMGMRNAALRKDLRLPDDATGIVLYFIDEFGAAHGRLFPRDVVLSIDGRPIADDGTIREGEETFLFAELMERKQWGDTLTLDIWRDGARQHLTIPLDHPEDPFAYRSIYDKRSPYVIVGGLVFAPLTREFLRTLPRDNPSIPVQELIYTVDYVKQDRLHTGRREFVVLIERLPHPVNTYLGEYQHGIVDRVNGRHIGSLSDLHAALATPQESFHVIHFIDSPDPLVLDAALAGKTESEILTRYQVPRAVQLETTP